MEEPSAEELKSRFQTSSKDLDIGVLEELQSIARMHQLTAQDMFFKWESYCIKLGIEEMQPTLERLQAFKQDLQLALEKSTRTQVHSKPEKKVGATPRTTTKTNGDVFGMIDGLVPNTPGARKSAVKRKAEPSSVSRLRNEHPASSPSGPRSANVEDSLNSLAPPTSFVDRPNPGEVIEILNEHLEGGEYPIAPFAASRIKLTAASDQKKLAYKTMGMKLSETSEILDDRIDDFLHIVKDQHKLEYDAFGNAAAQSTVEIVAVGRIASDALEGKLNAASLVLETSRRTGGGLRVPLDLGQIKTYHFFPGQIVALKGSNASGQAFTVTEILEVPLLPSAASNVEALQAHRTRLTGGDEDADDGSSTLPLNLMMASGPYTPDDNLDFEALHQLCSQAADTYADVLVLSGPFLDADHPLIASGDLDLPDDANISPDVASMSTVFKHMISPPLNRLVASNPAITILLVPSVRDVIDKHVSWPQDAFPRKDLGLHKNIRIVGNPMTLSINEIVVGVSSQDVLFELRHGELAQRPTDPNMMSRLSRYLIEQRHYFPVFPPTDREKLPKTGTEDGLATGAMLDAGYLKLGEMVNVRPDVLLVPSSLPPFAKVVESVLVINPGYLSKRRGAGTYARVSLREQEEQGGEAEKVFSHKVFERARVEITRI